MARRGPGRSHSLGSPPGDRSQDSPPPAHSRCSPQSVSSVGPRGHHHIPMTALAEALLLPVRWTGGCRGSHEQHSGALPATCRPGVTRPSSRNPSYSRAPQSSLGTLYVCRMHALGSNPASTTRQAFYLSFPICEGVSVLMSPPSSQAPVSKGMKEPSDTCFP